MTKEHFTKNGHLTKRGKKYSEVARVDIIKLEDPADAGLELYLIDKYKPKWNDRKKGNLLICVNIEMFSYYENLEKWKPYIFLKNLMRIK